MKTDFEKYVKKSEKENKELKSSNENFKNEVKNLKEKVERLEKAGPQTAGASSAVAVKSNSNKKKGWMPTNCEDLKQIGHSLQGFYTVQGKGVDRGHLEHVFCDFSKDLKKGNFVILFNWSLSIAKH